jgi:hypothetical protein
MVQQFTNVFYELLQENPKLKKRIAEYQVLDLWSTAVPGNAAKHSSAEKINKGILFVNTSSGAWAQQLSLLKPKIIKNLNAKLPEPLIKDIRFHPSGINNAGRQGPPEAESLAETNRVQKTKRKCSLCGVEWTWEGASGVCPQCFRVGRREREIKILREIASAPWIKFPQLKKEISDLEMDEFDKKKRYLKNRIYDTIKKIYGDLERGINISKEGLRALVCEYVFFQTELMPAELDETVIKNVIGEPIYSAIKSEKRGRRGYGKSRERTK